MYAHYDDLHGILTLGALHSSLVAQSAATAWVMKSEYALYHLAQSGASWL